MSQLQHQDNDTHIQPVPFSDGTDRRKSPRIPLFRPVKVGPPGGDVDDLVSASDLSANGLFIDADREVRVGARFSAEIPLTSGSVYIHEAEVAYNRERQHGSGFGVRFVAVSEDALQAVMDEIDKVTCSTIGTEDVSTPSSMMPTLPRAESCDLGIDVSCYPEPEIIDERLDPDAIPIPSRVGIKEEARAIGDRARERFLSRARAVPRVWTGLMGAGGLAVVAALGLALFVGPNAEAVEKEAEPERGLTATTHQVLMGNKSIETTVTSPPAAVTPTLDEQIPLVPLKKKRAAEAKERLARLMGKTEKKVVKKPVEKPAPVVEKKIEKKVEKKVEKAKEKRMSKRALAILGETRTAASTGRSKISIGVSRGVQVLKTHTLKSPPRFVIDLAGQEGLPRLPRVGGQIKNIRVGRHTEYVRIVIDSSTPIEAGHVSRRGTTLAVQLHHE